MILGKGALAVQRGDNRNVEGLGERDELGGRAGIEDALAGIDHRACGG